MDLELNEQVRKYADMAHEAARAEINNDFESKFANLREQLGSLSQSSVMDRESARLYADRVKALVQARADALIEGFELYGTLDEEAGRAIIEDVSRLHESMIEAIGGAAKHEAEMWLRRTNSNDPDRMARAREFGRQVTADQLFAQLRHQIKASVPVSEEQATILNSVGRTGAGPEYAVVRSEIC